MYVCIHVCRYACMNLRFYVFLPVCRRERGLQFDSIGCLGTTRRGTCAVSHFDTNTHNGTQHTQLAPDLWHLCLSCFHPLACSCAIHACYICCVLCVCCLCACCVCAMCVACAVCVCYWAATTLARCRRWLSGCARSQRAVISEGD